jgi:hypothetical protein
MLVVESPWLGGADYRQRLIDQYGYWKKVETIVVDFYITDYSVKNRYPIDTENLW